MRVGILSLILGLAMAGASAASDLLERMDRVECMAEGLLAGASMSIRLSETPREAALDSAQDGRHAELIRAAYDEPRRANPALQSKIFADRAQRACRSRLYLERQTALRDRIRRRAAAQKSHLGW